MDSHRASILVVDDDPSLRETVTAVLADAGFDVAAVGCGRDAVETARDRRFDVALTDLVMPGMDGVATMRALKALDPALEVIVMTAYGTRDSAATCRGGGAYDFVRKPLSADDLTSHVAHAVERRQLQTIVRLYEGSRALQAASQPADVVRLGLALGQQAVRASACVLIVPRAYGRDLHRAGAHKPSDELCDRLARRVASAQSPVLLSQDGERIPAGTHFEPYASALLCPLLSGARSAGALIWLRRFALAPFGSADAQRAWVLAAQLGVAVDRTRPRA